MSEEEKKVPAHVQEFLDQHPDANILTLDMDDPDFAAKLTQAVVGADSDGQEAIAIELMTPPIERQNGIVPAAPPVGEENWKALVKLTEDELYDMGLQVWDSRNGDLLWLFPGEWYASIPDGLELVDIEWDTIKFSPNNTDGDTRVGALPYGFLKETGEPTKTTH